MIMMIITIIKIIMMMIFIKVLMVMIYLQTYKRSNSRLKLKKREY